MKLIVQHIQNIYTSEQKFTNQSLFDEAVFYFKHFINYPEILIKSCLNIYFTLKHIIYHIYRAGYLYRSPDSIFDSIQKGAIWNFSSKMNPFLLPVCEGVVITHYNDPLVGFCYYL